VREDESLEQVVTTVLEHPGHHDVCVVDAGGHLVGVINIKKLFRSIFFQHTRQNRMTRQLMELTSSETAGHLMIKDPVYAAESEDLGSVIRKMVRYELGELPVLNDEGVLLGSVSMIHILEVWLERQNEETSSNSR